MLFLIDEYATPSQIKNTLFKHHIYKPANWQSKYGAGIVLQHSTGRAENKIVYNDVVEEVYLNLLKKIELAKRYNIKNIIIDPGIGFGKSKEDNFEILNRIEEFYSLNYPIMVGVSRKSFLGITNNDENELVGYLTPFLLKHKFASDYIVSDINYKQAINSQTFCKIRKNASGDIYLFSTVISPKYRDKILETENKNSKFYNKKTFKILNEELVNWIYSLKKSGVNIKYVFAEKVSADGEKYLKSLKMQNCTQ